MSHAMLEEQIKALPEECLEEVSLYIDYIIFRQQKKKLDEQNSNLVSFFGSIDSLPDGIELQRGVRSEWN